MKRIKLSQRRGTYYWFHLFQSRNSSKWVNRFCQRNNENNWKCVQYEYSSNFTPFAISQQMRIIYLSTLNSIKRTKKCTGFIVAFISPFLKIVSVLSIQLTQKIENINGNILDWQSIYAAPNAFGLRKRHQIRYSGH